MNIETCLYCGIVTPKTDGPTHRYLISTPGCWKAYGDVLAREYQDAQFFQYHDLTVDAYALQHPGKQSSQTINSANIHLVSLYAFFEKGYSASALSGLKQQIAKQSAYFTWLEPPRDMTTVNCSSLLTVADVSEYRMQLQEWAYYVFMQWEDHHDIAKSHIAGI